jgi:hypothetical protein
MQFQENWRIFGVDERVAEKEKSPARAPSKDAHHQVFLTIIAHPIVSVRGTSSVPSCFLLLALRSFVHHHNKEAAQAPSSISSKSS